MLVLALLHLPLIMAGIWLLQARGEAIHLEHRNWLSLATRSDIPLLPALGLISINTLFGSAIPLLGWIAILGTAVVRLLPCTYRLGNAQEVRLMLRQALGCRTIVCQ